MTWDRFAWLNAWVSDPRVTAETMAVLSVFFARAREADGMAWPSQQYIAKRIGKSARSVRRYLDQIEELGYLIPVGRPRGSRAYLPSTPGHPCPVDVDTHDHVDTHVQVDTHDHVDTHVQVKRTPMSGSSPSENRTPMTTWTPMSGRPGHGCPVDVDMGVLRTDQEQTKNRSSSAAAEDSPDPVALFDPETDPPSQRLLVICQTAGLNLSIAQVERLWSSVSDGLGTDLAWEYFADRVPELADTEYPVRAKYKFLLADVEDWRRSRAERQVGAHRPAATTPATEDQQPVPDLPDSNPAATAAWAEALPSVRRALPRTDRLICDLIRAVEVDGDALELTTILPEAYQDVTAFDSVIAGAVLHSTGLHTRWRTAPKPQRSFA